MKNTKGDGGRRVARVEQEIQKTVAQFLISGFRHPLPGLVTVARVMMPGDLRTAKVYISILGEEADRKKAVETLNSRAFEVQNYIGKELRMRFCPKISFYLDDTTEHVLRIDRILHDLHKEKGEGAAGDTETGPDSDFDSESSDEEK